MYSHTLISVLVYLAARSPVYSHISTTLQGLPTIRTFGQQEIAVQHFHTFNNEHTQVCLASLVPGALQEVYLSRESLWTRLSYWLLLHFSDFNVFIFCLQGWYLYLILTRWFGIRLDFLSSTVLVCVAFITIPLLSQTGLHLFVFLLQF